MKINQMRWVMACATAIALSACDMDLTDPNNPNEEDVITNPTGLKMIGVGLQAEYGNELVDPVYVDALVTDNIGAIPQTFESFRRVDEGLSIDSDLGPSTEPWTGMYDVVQIANVLLTNVPQVTWQNPATASSLIALAKLFKAMAFGNLLQIYERIPLETGLDNLNPEFATRAEGLAMVLQLLNEARNEILATPPSTEFNNEVLAPGFAFAATIDAMIARYALIAGDYAQAFAAAQRVPLNVLSEMRFSATDANPLWNLWLNSGNSTRMLPEDRFRTGAQAGDQRVAYWVAAAATAGSNPASPLDAHVRYAARDASFPLYFPDEMRLIMAEVYARNNDLPNALLLLNQVRTQCSSALAEPVACLPPLLITDVPTQAAMLAAIYRERQYELYLQGMHWSDARRFGMPLKYTFMMVSALECIRNSNAPPELCQAATLPVTP
ncbi:MAG TPA: RagB/SusD family nutrient uptake outer membrane protein [Longimicrobiales bacterium]|nr:RagB/SusD family nutrient uptake outer membrane protein [Longimicrobiales bacterium]